MSYTVYTIAYAVYQSIHLVYTSPVSVLIYEREAFLHNAENGSFHGSQNQSVGGLAVWITMSEKTNSEIVSPGR